jgi:hypothetical protein
MSSTNLHKPVSAVVWAVLAMVVTGLVLAARSRALRN